MPHDTTSRRVRPPAVAGRFYPAQGTRCFDAIDRVTAARPAIDLPARLVGGLVPHAGWVCSGRVAGLTWRALAQRAAKPTIFLTGSVHTVDLDGPALDSADAWHTPLGEVAVDAALREALGELDGFDTFDPAHKHEHALEVQLPMLRRLWGDSVRFVPCMIPPVADAPRWGRALGELFNDWPAPVLVVASSDLTHYGAAYDFSPHGAGAAGHRWAHEVNDTRLLERVQQMQAEPIVRESVEQRSACGGGAIAAVIAAAHAMGARHGYVLEQTDSARELTAQGYDEHDQSVGYASVVFG